MKAIITTFDVGNGFLRELNMLRKLGLEAEYQPLDACQEPGPIIKALKDADFVLAGVDRYNAEVIDALKGRLKLIARLGTGIDKVDVDAATRNGIAVCNTPGANACAVAQHTLGLMLDVSLRISQQDRAMRSGITLPRRLGSDLVGKTVGLVGFGHTARHLIRQLAGFDVTILVSDKHNNQDAAQEFGVTLVDSLDDLAERCDYISLHVPLNQQNHHLISAEFLRKMKTTAFLINTSRGAIVDEAALIEALEENRIAGAALDVFEQNPLPGESPLLSLDNTVVTPYVAYATEQSHRQVLDMAIGSIEDYLAGRPIRNLRNPDYAKYRRNA